MSWFSNLYDRSTFSIWPRWLAAPTNDSATTYVRTVAVIGAGPSGAAVAKYLHAEGHFAKIDVFERRSVLGGVWNTDESSPICDIGKFPSPIYEGMESNLPIPVMQYFDTNFKDGTPILPDAKTTRDYLVSYGEALSGMVHFRTEVLKVEPLREQETSTHKPWLVRYRSLETSVVFEEVYDAVVVCNGRYNQPYIPDVTGLKEWQLSYPGSISHSSEFRSSERFKGKKVLIVGYSHSGSDLASHIVKQCATPLLISTRSVYQRSANDTSDDKMMLPQVKELQSEGRAVHFVDGHVETDVDHILFATGFDYEHDFLSHLDDYKEHGATGVNTNTYLHMFWTPRPTLAFVLLPLRVLAFPFAESQAAVIARTWSGRLRLPSKEAMNRWVTNTSAQRGKGRAYHTFGSQDDVKYMSDLFDLCMTADEPHAGKLPPAIDARYRWLKKNAGAIRKAAEGEGENRHQVTKPEDVGFHFEGCSDDAKPPGNGIASKTNSEDCYSPRL
ncbi:related to flavin-containing monooxygenase [Ramularia collo-cygni]|uniref:Related to flavin-containing monooxygenase n=1 Tax=Ramularia collo-cygni TaxID=112498 RepID=A0A2D3UVD7_9PEZI|nr:related to flavin-containing monooxygenase [Ramularia collo-cygni]CZT16057.1 related to flavin-containing monooxygenase [Ramularia collo-cygni]